MGSSSKNDMSPGMATPEAGATPPPAAPPFLNAGFPGPAQYQGFAHQPFNENNEVYASFLPRNPTASATGLDQAMLNAIMGISPRGKGRVAAGAADPNAPAADAPPADPNALGLPPKIGMPTGQGEKYWDANAQMIADAYNQKPSLEGYLSAREQLAGIMNRNSQGNSGRSSGGGIR